MNGMKDCPCCGTANAIHDTTLYESRLRRRDLRERRRGMALVWRALVDFERKHNITPDGIATSLRMAGRSAMSWANTERLKELNK